MQENIHVRIALPADIPILRALIDASARGLQAQITRQHKLKMRSKRFLA
jgi:hypothetical protein